MFSNLLLFILRLIQFSRPTIMKPPKGRRFFVHFSLFIILFLFQDEQKMTLALVILIVMAVVLVAIPNLLMWIFTQFGFSDLASTGRVIFGRYTCFYFIIKLFYKFRRLPCDKFGNKHHHLWTESVGV
jgi:hypothetical protein